MPDEYWMSVAREADEKRRLSALQNAQGMEQRLRETAARGQAMARKPDSLGQFRCARCRRWIAPKRFYRDKAAKTRRMSWCKACLDERKT
jgi:hypothetical protein